MASAKQLAARKAFISMVKNKSGKVGAMAAKTSNASAAVKTANKARFAFAKKK